MASKALITSELTQHNPDGLSAENMPVSEDKRGIPGSIPVAIPVGSLNTSSLWLCPIQSNTHRRGILQMTEADYFNLVDQSGRLLRADKRGAIDPQLAPILLRIGANPQAWIDTISRFGPNFRLAAGLIASLRDFADQLGKRWFVGIAAARAAFT